MSGKKDHGLLYRGKPLQSWASKTPYNMIARMLDNAVMRLSKHGFLYIQGFSPAMDRVVSVHYQTKKRQPARPARFTLKGSGYDTPNENWTFSSINELERVLVPPCGDIKWVETVSELTQQVLTQGIRYYVHKTSLLDDAVMLKEARAMIYHCDPSGESRSPIKFMLPSDSRDIVYALISAYVTGREVQLSEEQEHLVNSMFNALEQVKMRQGRDTQTNDDVNSFNIYMHASTRMSA